MITIEKDLDNIHLSYSFSGYDKEDILFFDIETTGFSPENTVMYLIGCTYYSNGSYHLIQWFADDKNSELNMLHSFFDFLSRFRLLVHFNGNGFDIPYIQKKILRYHLSYSFDIIESFDIYKVVTPFKHIFKLENYKLKTIESFLKINREDKYSGGELIQIYANYLKCKTLDIQNNTTSITTSQLLKLLLLHNEDDVIDMINVCDIIKYTDILSGLTDSITSLESANIIEDELVFTARHSYEFNIPLRYKNETCYLCIDKQFVTLKVLLYRNELKYFYDNYNDYYYLPDEDTAIHKSIALYVDKDFKTKAKAANCYTRKTGIFIPQYEEVFSPYFKINYKDKITYIEVNDDFLDNENLLLRYIESTIKHGM